MPEQNNIKELLHHYCARLVEERIARIQQEIALHQAAANEETKNSAGDKYETGRAMAQLEIERDLVQLKEAEKLWSSLHRIGRGNTGEVIVPGSLVATSKGVFFIAVSIGAVTIEQREYFILSPDSPIGKLLLGKKTGEKIVWRNDTYVILGVE